MSGQVYKTIKISTCVENLKFKILQLCYVILLLGRTYIGYILQLEFRSDSTDITFSRLRGYNVFFFFVCNILCKIKHTTINKFYNYNNRIKTFKTIPQ